jgi:hypothetical protein
LPLIETGPDTRNSEAENWQSTASITALDPMQRNSALVLTVSVHKMAELDNRTPRECSPQTMTAKEIELRWKAHQSKRAFGSDGRSSQRIDAAEQLQKWLSSQTHVPEWSEVQKPAPQFWTEHCVKFNRERAKNPPSLKASVAVRASEAPQPTIAVAVTLAGLRK